MAPAADPKLLTPAALARGMDVSVRRVVLAYLSAGLVWIAGGDALIGRLVVDEDLAGRLQTYIGMLLVLSTALMVLWLVRRLARRTLSCQELLVRAENSFLDAFQRNPNPMWVYDPDSLRMLDANQAALLFYGFRREEFLRLSLRELWADPPERLHGTLKLIRKAPERIHQGCFLHRVRNGATRNVEVRDGGFHRHGRAARLVVVHDRTRETEALKQSEQALARMEEAQKIAQLGSWEIDPGNDLGYYSDELYRMFRLRPSRGGQLQPRHYSVLLDHVAGAAQVQARIRTLVERIGAGTCERIDTLLEVDFPQGGRRILHVRAEAPADSAGAAGLVRGTMQDVTESEQMRGALASSNRELHAMAKRLFSLQEDERQAISRELHDDIGQAITAIKLSAHAAAGEEDPARRSADLQGIVLIADETVGKLRNISTLLRPPQLDALGLEAALRWQAGMLFRASQAALALDVAPLPRRPPAEIELACFRIAQEGLTNALRHAQANTVWLSLRIDGDDQLCLEVADDGCGFDHAQERSGLGLIVMRERAQAVGGQLRIESLPEGGTRLELRFPYAAEACDAQAGPARTVPESA